MSAGPQVSEPRGLAAGWAALAALGLGYAALYLATYPPISGIQDEVGFLNQTVVWSRGAISAEGAGLEELGDFYPIAGRHVAGRHPGRSLAALPFVLVGGLKAVYLSGLALQLATAAVAGLLLARLGHSPLWAVLVLAHPTLAIYSRTMLADGAAGLGLLLAALAATFPGLAGAIGAGLAVGLAALMRYHAGLALPIVAGWFLTRPERPDRRRDALACLLAGSAFAAAIVAYNLVVYRAPMDPFSAKRGRFATEYLVGHGLFYGSALLAIWPGMLLAPALDRSPIRWLVRGVGGLFFVFLSFYYFHDQAAGRLETLVIGQRLLQVAIPLWIVSYAGVLDDWLARPLARRLGRRVWAGLVALGCLGLLAGDGLIFRKHQAHLLALRADRDAIAAVVPDGARVATDGTVTKLFGVAGGPRHYRMVDYFESETLAKAAGTTPWYLVYLPHLPGEPLPEPARAAVARYQLAPLATGSSRVEVYRAPGASPP